MSILRLFLAVDGRRWCQLFFDLFFAHLFFCLASFFCCWAAWSTTGQRQPLFGIVDLLARFLLVAKNVSCAFSAARVLFWLRPFPSNLRIRDPNQLLHSICPSCRPLQRLPEALSRLSHSCSARGSLWCPRLVPSPGALALCGPSTPYGRSPWPKLLAAIQHSG